MEFLRGIIEYVVANKENIAEALVAIVGAAILISRFTPTKSDDNAVHWIANKLNIILDFFKIPNFRVKLPEEKKEEDSQK